MSILVPSASSFSPPVNSTIFALSAQLKAGTASLHCQVESLLGLPDTIASRDDYRNLLARFLGFYEPLEQALAAFPDWIGHGFSWTPWSYTSCLTADLSVLGADPRQVIRAPSSLVPLLPTLAHAVGALYVVEGATLGGRVILRHARPRIDPSIDGAERFFGGRGDAVGPMWNRFRAALDHFGGEWPQSHAAVVTGAERTFGALLTWFAPFCSAPARSS